MANNIDLSIDFCGVKFKNPFLLSSSPVSNSAEMVAKSFDAGWSGVVFKTLNSGRLPIVHPHQGWPALITAPKKGLPFRMLK